MTVIAGRYRLLDVVAEGATGTVWRALDETDRREVALKELRAPDGLPADKALLLFARREREARAAARISHPAVVRVLGVATEDGRPWAAMELVRGLTLAETLEADGPLPAREAARMGAEVLAGLRAVREAGVPHREVDPEHVLLANDGRIVVTGFGTAPGDDPGPAAERRALGRLLAAALPPPSAAEDEGVRELRALAEESAGEDRDVPADPDRVERELRRLAAGGARLAPTGSAGTAGPPGAPAGTSAGPAGAGRGRRGEGDGEGRGGNASAAGGGAAPDPAGPPVRARSPRRSHVVLAGVVGALLIAGALAYHLVRDDESGTGPGPGGVTSTAPADPGAADGGSAPPRS
ncbi:protein kinase [Streptomyces sp. NPDC004330]|uniref:protein kinase domain-containing protein n=1 Tax=Streptomyces sp. NPDC004330 TaxID=3364700 RepID=UPI0036BBF1EC